MTARLDRILALAQRLDPDVSAGDLFDLLMTFPPHLRERGPAAIEAALLVLLGEPQPFVVELAERWRFDAGEAGATEYDFNASDTLMTCADELLAAAKAGT